MLSLIIVASIVFRIVYCIKRKKEILASEVFVGIVVVLMLIEGAILVCFSSCMETIKRIPKYQEENQVIEAQMKELKDDFTNQILENPEQSKENLEYMFEVYTTAYEELKDEFEANNRFINENSQLNLSVFKYLLYFGH